MMDNPNRIEVSFGVDVNAEALDAVLQTLEELRPGTVEYCAEWDKLKDLYQHFLGRLEGECAAYMNIAKERARQRFDM